jgi:hypothetical protein
MKIAPLDFEHLPEISGWFAGVRWPMPGTDNVLPKGFVAIDENGELVACAFVYTTETAMGYMSWLGVNPKHDAGVASHGLRCVITKIQELCEKVSPKISLLMTHTKSDALAVALTNLGFRKDSGYHQMTWLMK